MDSRQSIAVVALGAIALGWFIGSGAKGFSLPQLPQAPPPHPVGDSAQDGQPNQIDQLWQNVGQNIGQDPQAAIDTVKAWRDRANSEMEYEPPMIPPGAYHAPDYTPMSYGPRFATGATPPSTPPTTGGSGRSVAIGSGFPSLPSAPRAADASHWPSEVTVSSPIR
ncbi:MAG: hypothetical protein KF812_12270 [Fimbriimonadaceae bacterium]|nr:hypothetical protein [Fimbriimonadaceae bacterium]